MEVMSESAWDHVRKPRLALELARGGIRGCRPSGAHPHRQYRPGRVAPGFGPHPGGLVCERIPYLILPVRQLSREPFGSRRSATSEPPGKPPGPSRPNHPPKRRERAVGQYAGPVSFQRSAEAPRASRRASRRARLEPNHTPKQYERAAGPVSSRSDIRRPSGTPPGMRQPTAVATRCASTPPSARASGLFHYRTEPLRLFAVNPQTVGELGSRVIGEVILV